MVSPRSGRFCSPLRLHRPFALKSFLGMLKTYGVVSYSGLFFWRLPSHESWMGHAVLYTTSPDLRIRDGTSVTFTFTDKKL